MELSIDLPHRLGTVTLTASGSIVVDVEPQVRSLLDRDVVVTVEVDLPEPPAVAKLTEDCVCGWELQSIAPGVAHDRRFKSAINASPFVALEAKDAQLAMVFGVATL